jgi:DNA-binding CsgD family transcriptional regulator
MELDAITAIEAAYAPLPARHAWVQGILESLAPLDQGRGLYGMVLDASEPARIRVQTVAALRPDPEFVTLGDSANADADSNVAHMKALYWRAPPVVLASRRLRSVARALPEVAQATLRMTDVLGVFAVDSDDRGIFIGIPWPHRRAPPPRTVHLLSRIAAHVTSAWRLRSWTDPDGDCPPNDAVLAPSGAVLDAHGWARAGTERALLGEAVRRMERARTRARVTDAVDAAALWRALVDGRWTLVDFVDTDGRRFLLARRNAPHGREPKALTPLERSVAAFAVRGHANKYIAYLLGVAPSSVSSALASAYRKFGVRSRLELVRVFGRERPA